MKLASGEGVRVSVGVREMAGEAVNVNEGVKVDRAVAALPVTLAVALCVAANAPGSERTFKRKPTKPKMATIASNGTKLRRLITSGLLRVLAANGVQ